MPLSSIPAALRARYLDVLASVYIYNEHRGYSSLDRVLDAARRCCRDNPAFIAEIEQHRADEAKHYAMFKRYFQLKGAMPLAVGRACGHIDHFIEWMFGCSIDELDTDGVVADPARFERLCRVIMLTEQRGVRYVDELLANPLVARDPVLVRIFRIIRRDEPSHWQPYDRWLTAHNAVRATWRERLADSWIHKSLMLVKLPWVFVNLRTARLTQWPDEQDAAAV